MSTTSTLTGQAGRARRAAGTAGAVALALALSGCADSVSLADATGGRGGALNPAERRGSGNTGVAEPLAEFYDQQLRWRSCNAGLECATLRVPLDYTAPDERAIDIAVARSSATGTGPSIGSLLLNPGGPGGSGIDFLVNSAGAVSPEVRARYDLVSFDPRGVGRSTAVDCLTDRQLDTYLAADATPDDEAELAEFVQLTEDVAALCEDRSGWLLPHVGTVDAARDMDVLRAALGERKLDYLGYSYGTYLGATYADQFPDRVGHFVLDGALDPTLSAAEIGRGQAVGFQQAWDRFTEYCAANACMLGDTGARVSSGVAKFLVALDTEPLPTQQDRDLTQSLGTLGIITGMYSDASWPALAEALEQAYAGDGSALLGFADAYAERGPDGTYTNNGIEANMAVNCIDHPGGITPAQARDSLAEFMTMSPMFGDTLGWSLGCTYWPVQAEDSTRALRAEGADPILVIGTTRDPATPYAWSQALAEQLSSGVLLTYDADGHTAYGRGSACIDRAVDAYLLRGEEPDAAVVCSGA